MGLLSSGENLSRFQTKRPDGEMIAGHIINLLRTRQQESASNPASSEHFQCLAQQEIVPNAKTASRMLKKHS
jgi:hypothetical protein